MKYRDFPVPLLFDRFELREGGLVVWKRLNKRRGQGEIGKQAGWLQTGYIYLSMDRVRFPVHAIVFAMTHGRWPEHEIDHIDGDRLNNEPSNLREATRGQNLANTKLRVDNKARVKGVCWCPDRKKWVTQIQVNKMRKMKRFDSLEEAKSQYERWAQEGFGQFACKER